MELALPPQPLAGGERDSIATASAWSAAELPARKPLIRDLRVDRSGWLWVRRWTPAPGEDSWDVFDGCGDYPGSAAPPAPLDIIPWLPIGAASLLAVTGGAFDEEYVVRLRMERSDGNPPPAAKCTF